MEEINRLVDNKDYKGAMEVVDSIDWRRVKNVRNLCVVGEIYAANKRYEDSKEIFLLAYHRAPIGKNILYRLIEVSLKMNDIEEANEFYEEYLEVAPNDSTQYILKYKIARASQAPVSEQIRILEDYKEREFTERWSYELARLYYQNGDKDKCLDLCNEMILWFSDGKYVMKALDLKNRMGQLTGEEKEKYESQFVPNLRSVDQKGETAGQEKKEDVSEEDVPVIESVSIDERDVNSAESLQEKISKGIRDIFNSRKKEEAEDTLTQEEELTSGKDQDEMIKDISSEEKTENVPYLEPEEADSVNSEETEEEITEEDASVEEIEEELEKFTGEQEENRDEESEQETADEEKKEEVTLPELEIPESMKNLGIENPLHTEIPKAPDTVLPDAENKDSEKEFNLEDTILAAASAQGIDIPEEGETGTDSEKEMEDDGDDVFYEGGQDEDDFYEEDDEELNDEEFFGSDPEEDDFYEEEETEEEFDEEPEEDDFGEEDRFENIDDYEEDDELDELPVVSRSPLTEENRAVLQKTTEIKAVKKKKQERKLTEEEKLEKFVDSLQQEDHSRDIIPREKALTEDETKLFTYMAKVPGLREQIISALCDVQAAASDKTSRTGNIIVMGGKETGKTRLISSLIPAICSELNLEAAKVAYVFADQINGKNITEIVRKMAGGFLVIENANQLKKDTVNQLSKAMEFRTDSMFVILEDEKISMRKLMARFPKFTSKFTSVINIPVFTNDELVNFAKVYTRENGYTIDQMAMLTLYNLISTNQKDDQPMNVGAVKEIIDNAISKSRGGIRKLKRNISKKRTNPDGFVVLYEKDFN
ncbi:MAG: hypothetical protein ACLRTI_10195 [Blautia sp.]